MQVIVNKGNKPEAISLEDFIKEYGITPKCQGENFYVIGQQDRDYFIQTFPNKACAFLTGRIQYIVYKGPMQMVINGHVVPPYDFIEEDQVFNSEEECLKTIHDIEDAHKGEIMYIDCPDGRRIMMS